MFGSVEVTLQQSHLTSVYSHLNAYYHQTLRTEQPCIVKSQCRRHSSCLHRSVPCASGWERMHFPRDLSVLYVCIAFRASIALLIRSSHLTVQNTVLQDPPLLPRRLWYLCRISSGLKRLVKFCKGTRAVSYKMCAKVERRFIRAQAICL